MIDAVTAYQTYKQTFPPVFIANSFGFSDAAYLDLEADGNEHKRENIDISFDDSDS